MRGVSATAESSGEPYRRRDHDSIPPNGTSTYHRGRIKPTLTERISDEATARREPYGRENAAAAEPPGDPFQGLDYEPVTPNGTTPYHRSRIKRAPVESIPDEDFAPSDHDATDQQYLQAGSPSFRGFATCSATVNLGRTTNAATSRATYGSPTTCACA
ncbi:hypothetical protein GE061_007674 [Apolygus lucorum]|uniref:Uncharacterized protein n=1 Tax=Apolygus lucorum TaxID=248454 RepID=A0A8S9WP61_APOLU|nr:hypothetical protein GE061_007674 [Apolygus lucorum]